MATYTVQEPKVFDGSTDGAKFVAAVEAFCNAVKIEGKEEYIRTRLKKEVAQSLLARGIKFEAGRWEDIVKMLKEFSRETDDVVVKRQLYTRQQKAKESTVGYLVAIQSLAYEAKEEKEATVMKIFEEGLRDEVKVQMRLLKSQAELKYEEALKHAIQIDSKLQQAADKDDEASADVSVKMEAMSLRGRGATASRGRGRGRGRGSSRGRGRGNGFPAGSDDYAGWGRTCWFCGAAGHVERNCDAWKKARKLAQKFQGGSKSKVHALFKYDSDDSDDEEYDPEH